MYLRLKQYAAQHGGDTYVVMLPVTTILLLSLRRFISGSIIVSERSDPDRYGFAIKVLLKNLLKRADGFVAQLPNVLKYYEKPLIDCKTTVIPNGIDAKCGCNSTTDPIREKRILSAGRLIPVKNHACLIRAFSYLAREHPEYRLVIYGEGKLRHWLEKLIIKLNLEDKVSMPGYDDDIRSQMRNSELFVLPSRHEGIPNVLLEAMAEGMCVIAADCPIGGPAYLIHDSETGFLVPVDDDRALFEKMSYVIDKGLCRDIGDNASKRISEFDDDAVNDRWMEFVSSFSEGKDV